MPPPQVRVAELTADKAGEALAVVVQGPWDTGVRRALSTNLLLPRTLLACLATTLVTFCLTSSLLVAAAIGCGLLPLAYYVMARRRLLRWHVESFTDMVNPDTFFAHWTSEGRRMWFC